MLAPPPTVSDTGARPLTPIARAAAGLKSMTRPRTKGPRSLIRTITARPVRLLTTVTLVAEWQGAMGGSHGARIHALPTRGTAAAVNRGNARSAERPAHSARSTDAFSRLRRGENAGKRKGTCFDAVPSLVMRPPQSSSVSLQAKMMISMVTMIVIRC